MNLRDAKNLWNMYNSGVIGPYKDYIIAYNQNAQLHFTQQLYISAHKKKHRSKPVNKFKDMYPEVYKWWSLGTESAEECVDYNERMFQDMMNMRGVDTPDWVTKPIAGEDDNGK